MADTSIHQSTIVNGWVISPSNGVYRAVNKHGQIGFAGTENQAHQFADSKSNNSKKKI